MIKFLAGELSMWIRDRFERTIGNHTLWMEPLVRTEPFINNLGRFFH